MWTTVRYGQKTKRRLAPPRHPQATISKTRMVFGDLSGTPDDPEVPVGATLAEAQQQVGYALAWKHMRDTLKKAQADEINATKSGGQAEQEGRWSAAARSWAVAAAAAYLEAEIGRWDPLKEYPEIYETYGPLLSMRDVADAESRGATYVKRQKTAEANARKVGIGAKGMAASRPSVQSSAGRFFATRPASAVTPVEASGELSDGAKIAIGVGTAALAVGAAWYFLG